MKINEIFYSLQGEGFYSGIPAVFVRFSGCNLKCAFCDTDFESGKEMSEYDILSEINKYPSPHVIFTGGEPSLQLTQSLVDQCHINGKFLHIETNGTMPIPEHIDWITCSPKENTTLKISRIDEIKVVYLGQDLTPYENIPCKHYFLQPCSCKNTKLVIDYILKHPLWRLSLQIHKYLLIK